ncbi:MAG: general secretion pathway protein GspB [Pseudomonadota bacterium]
MSLILDALKKAEQDRHAGQAPVLDELLVRRTPVARHRHDPQQEVLLAAAAIAALLFAAAGLAYWFWPVPQTAAETTAVPAPASSEAAASPGSPLRIDPERLEAPIADVPPDAVETIDTGAAEAMTMDELDGDTPPPRKPAAAPVVMAPEAAAPVQVRPAPEPEPDVVATPPPPAAPVEPAVRALKDMPPAFRSEFPRLSVDIHVYDDNPLRRFVLVNGKKYRETDTLIDGPRVVEITPDGVIVEQRGSQVLLELPR